MFESADSGNIETGNPAEETREFQFKTIIEKNQRETQILNNIQNR